MLRIIFSVFLFLSTAALAQDAAVATMSDADLRDALTRQAPLSRTGGAQFSGDKCRLPLVMEAWTRVQRGGASMESTFREVFARPSLQTSVLSAQGNFRVHYDTVGVNTPALLDAQGQRINGTAHVYADSVARFFELTYVSEVIEQGYGAPPIENGHSAFNIYIVEEFGSIYGETVPVHPVAGDPVMPLSATYIELDNDFREYPTKGLDGARVTAAHEYHHAIQLGIYGWWASDIFMYEMTSTCMEDIVFDGVDDYLYYLGPPSGFYTNHAKSLYAWRGYEAVLFPLRTYEMSGPGPWRDIWMEMKRQAPIPSMRAVYSAGGTDLASEFCDFSRWIYRSGYRSHDNEQPTFKDAHLYPAASLYFALPLVGNEAVFNGALPPLASHYVRAIDGADTLTLSVSNIDEQMATDKTSTQVAFTLTVARHSTDDSHTELGSNWSYKFEPGSPGSLCVSAYEQSAVATVSSGSAYPNPFRPVRDGIVRFPLTRKNGVDHATLHIHSSGMIRVASYEALEIRNDETFGTYISWDGTDSRGEAVPSGVYFYTVTAGGEQKTGKVAVIRR